VFGRRLWSEAGAYWRATVTKEGIEGEARTHETNAPGGGAVLLATARQGSENKLALGCWIEGLPEEGPIDPYAAIDYEGCSLADQPPLFVEPEPEFDTD